MNKDKLDSMRNSIENMSGGEILDKYTYLVHTRGQKQALGIPIEADLDEEMRFYRGVLRTLLMHTASNRKTVKDKVGALKKVVTKLSKRKVIEYTVPTQVYGEKIKTGRVKARRFVGGEVPDPQPDTITLTKRATPYTKRINQYVSLGWLRYLYLRHIKGMSDAEIVCRLRKSNLVKDKND